MSDIQDLAGNLAAGFTDEPVVNATGTGGSAGDSEGSPLDSTGTGTGDWLVELYNQDGSNDPNAKELVATVRPESLHFVLNTGVVGPHEIDFELSLTTRDVITDELVVRSGPNEPWIGPYRTDFALRRTDLHTPLITGMVTPYGGVPAGDGYLKVSGKSYLHYLERRRWPYDATLSYVNWPAGFRFTVAAAEIGQIVKDVLETIRDVSPNFPSAPDASFPSYSLDYTVNVDSTGHTINYEIGRFESQSIYELVRTLAEQHVEQGGFDFYMTWDKVFRLAYPEEGDPTRPIFTLGIDPETNQANMLTAEQTNDGVDYTHLLGVGAGTANKQGGINKHFRHNSSRFRRLDGVEDFGDVKNLDALESLTGAYLQRGANPQFEVPITVDPDTIPGFWGKVRPPGQYVMLAFDFGYAHPAGVHKIASIDCTVDNQGNTAATLGLNMHHATIDPGTAGLADW